MDAQRVKVIVVSIAAGTALIIAGLVAFTGTGKEFIVPALNMLTTAIAGVTR
mgnify:CR=1 FL=1